MEENITIKKKNHKILKLFKSEQEYYMGISRIAGLMAAVSNQKFLTGGEINQFNLPRAYTIQANTTKKSSHHYSLNTQAKQDNHWMGITHQAVESSCTTPNCSTLPVYCGQVSPQWRPLDITFCPVLHKVGTQYIRSKHHGPSICSREV